jgi:hypothetical protein
VACPTSLRLSRVKAGASASEIAGATGMSDGPNPNHRNSPPPLVTASGRKKVFVTE